MKLSIITINYNNAAGLKQTLDSVAMQDCTDFEHVIVDGASTDDSIDIVRAYSQLPIANRYKITWLSEPDTGIYNAMNKGIKIASGDYLLFLNSGDVFVNTDVVQQFYDTPITVDVATGIEQESNGRLIYPKQEDELSYFYFYDDTLMHQSTFIRRDAFDRFGMYNERYRIVSDWEWFFKALMVYNASYQTLDFVVSIFDGEGISNSHKAIRLHNNEREQVRQSILPRVRVDYNELKRLKNVEKEFIFLKNGKMGWIVRLLLKLKSIKTNK